MILKKEEKVPEKEVSLSTLDKIEAIKFLVKIDLYLVLRGQSDKITDPFL